MSLSLPATRIQLMPARYASECRPFALLLAISSLVAGSAWGQSVPDGSITQAELRRSHTYAAAVVDTVSDRLRSRIDLPSGAARSPERSAGEKAADLASALAEDAGYRLATAAKSILGFRPSSIINGNWKKVTNTKTIPYKAVCYIQSVFPDGTVASGTAFFIGRRLLITNAHCCWDDEFGGWADSIEVYPATSGQDDPYGSQAAFEFILPQQYIDWNGRPNESGRRDYDIAWIVLEDRTLYNRVGWYFGYAKPTDRQLEYQQLRSAGYPEPDKKNYRMYTDTSTKRQDVFVNRFHHYHDTQGGSSGSPMFYKRSSYYVMGVHCAGSPAGEKYNTATRMTDTYYQWTSDFKKQYP